MTRRDQRSLVWPILAGTAAFAVVATVTGLVAPPSTAAPSGPRRIALIGDSYAVGLGPELAKLVPGLPYEGHVGIGTRGWLQCTSCGNWLADYRPAVVLVSLGVNDGIAPNPADYHALVQKLHGLGASVIWIEPPAAVNAPEPRAVIAGLGVQTVPATATPLRSDHLHPQTYAPWAAEIARAVQ